MLSFLYRGDFLTRDRLRLWSIGFLVAFAVSIVFLVVTAHDLNDYKGRPLGTDFSDVYTAGMLTSDGVPEAAFDPARHYRQEQAVFGVGTPFYGWHYPPFFLFAASALAQLPYIPALVVWLTLTLAAYLVAMRRLLADGPAPELACDPMWLAAALAFPAVFVNLSHGQNGFLTAALFAGALTLLDRRPIVAGLLFGLIAYKPQFGVLIPVVLAASGRWKTFAAAAATIALLAAAATIVFGADIWAAFLGSMPFSRVVVLEQGGTGFEKIQSVFAAVRLLGGPVALAYAAQGAAAVMAATALAILWRGPASSALKGTGLCLGALLATPYCLDYDLMLLAPAIALLAAEGRARGFLAGEHLVLAALWLVPIATRSVAHAMLVPLGLIAVAAGFAIVVRRALPGRLAALPVRNLT